MRLLCHVGFGFARFRFILFLTCFLPLVKVLHEAGFNFNLVLQVFLSLHFPPPHFPPPPPFTHTDRHILCLWLHNCHVSYFNVIVLW